MAINDSTQITQDTTVTAQYTAKTYTVTIYPNGASGSNKTYSVTHGSSFSVPPCPFSRSNYSFTGYKTSSSSGTSYSSGNRITVTGNIKLYCQWKVSSYTVTIYPNGASGSTKTYTVSAGSSWSIPSCPFSRSGYSFNGYRTSSSSGTSYSAGNRITVNSNISLYCQWGLSISSISLTANTAVSYWNTTYSGHTQPSGSGTVAIWSGTTSYNIEITANTTLTNISAKVNGVSAKVSGKNITCSGSYSAGSGTGGRKPSNVIASSVTVVLTSGSQSSTKKVTI